MLSPNEGCNETGLTQQSAGPVREPGQAIEFHYQFKGSEFGHWKIRGGKDTFAFRHPSLGQMDVQKLLESDAHHHKVGPISVGRLIAFVGGTDASYVDNSDWQVIFGLVLSVTAKGTKRKDELPSERIYRQCHPKEVEVVFLSSTAVEFFAKNQLQRLHDLYLVSNKGLVVIDAIIQNDTNPLPTRFLLKDLWIFGNTKPTCEITAVAQTHPCRYHLGLGIYNVETAVEGIEGDKRSHLNTTPGRHAVNTSKLHSQKKKLKTKTTNHTCNSRLNPDWHATFFLSHDCNGDSGHATVSKFKNTIPSFHGVSAAMDLSLRGGWCREENIATPVNENHTSKISIDHSPRRWSPRQGFGTTPRPSTRWGAGPCTVPMDQPGEQSSGWYEARPQESEPL